VCIYAQRNRSAAGVCLTELLSTIFAGRYSNRSSWEPDFCQQRNQSAANRWLISDVQHCLVAEHPPVCCRHSPCSLPAACAQAPAHPLTAQLSAPAARLHIGSTALHRLLNNYSHCSALLCCCCQAPTCMLQAEPLQPASSLRYYVAK
jgi:hypothetical protein